MRKAGVGAAIGCLMVFLMQVSALAAPAEFSGLVPDTNYILQDDERVPIPALYELENVLVNIEDDEPTLLSPEDLFIAATGEIYVADTGHNRILRFDENMKVTGCFREGDGLAFQRPSGVFADEKGDIFVADTDNGRIVQLDREGGTKAVLTEPLSEMYEKTLKFLPKKVAVDSLGTVYVLNSTDFHGLITLDMDNQFKGYVAPTKLEYSFLDTFIRLFASEEQKEQIAKRVPAYHSNFMIADDGMIYVTTLWSKKEQVKKITFSGDNVYPKVDLFGERHDNTRLYEGYPGFVDVAVDSNGIVTALDSVSKKLYQYDGEGNLLGVFGGEGSWAGRFKSPVSVAVDRQQRLYVLDSALNNIQVFTRTQFATAVQQGIVLFHEGKYDEAFEPWSAALQIDANYPLAYMGIGKVFYKQGQLQEAMDCFSAVNDKKAYSTVFQEYRLSLFQQYFGWIVLVIALLTAGIVFLLIRVKRAADRYVLTASLQEGRWGIRGFGKSILLYLVHPLDAFYLIKRDRRHIRALPVCILTVALIAAILFGGFGTHFPLAAQAPEDLNIWMELGKIFLPLLTFVGVNFALTSIMNGKQQLKECLLATLYCMIPYILFSPLLVFMSNLLGIGEADIYYFLWTIIWSWVLIMCFAQVYTMNEYSFKKTIGVIVLTLLGMVFVWAIAVVFFVLITQMYSFILDIVREIHMMS